MLGTILIILLILLLIFAMPPIAVVDFKALAHILRMSTGVFKRRTASANDRGPSHFAAARPQLERFFRPALLKVVPAA